MGRHHPPVRSGRLHGRLLQALGGFSVLVAVVAMWQLGVFGGEPDRDPIGTVEGPETDWFSPGHEDTSATGSAEAASATAASPSESSAAPTSQAPSDAATSTAAAEETSAREEEEEEDDDEEEHAPAGTSCSAALTLDEEWEDGVTVTVTVVNTGGTELESWAIDLDLDDAEVSSTWNMEELGRDWYGAAGWNGRLDPGEDTVVGFQARTDRGFELPGSVPCAASD
jgi:hypothetical protein